MTGLARRILGVVIVVAVAAALVYQSQRALARLGASVVLEGAELTATGMVSTGRIDRAVLGRNLEALRRAADAAPGDPRIPLAIGSHHLLLGNRAAAAHWYRLALEVEPRPEILLNLGRTEWAVGEEIAALEHLRQALLLEPAWLDQIPQGALARLGALAPPAP